MMASDFCFRCGTELVPGAARCSSCGAIARTVTPAGGGFSLFRAFGYVAATLAFVLVLVLAWGWFNNGVSQAQHQTDLQIQQYASSSPR